MRRRWKAWTAVACLLAGVTVAVASPQAAFASQIGDAAANIALSQLGPNYSPGNIENPMGSGCNKYTGALYGATSGCASGYGNKGAWGTWAWCSDFATWVWKQAGIDTSGLNSGAISFYNYGVAHGTWHPAGSGYTPQPGDAILYGINSAHSYAAHVGIVANSSGPGVVQGNWDYNYPNAAKWGVAWDGNGVDVGASISGYVSPVGGSGPSGNTGQVIASPCLNLRLGMSNGTPSIGCIPDGTTITVDCVLSGQSVTGPYGTENTWDHTSYNGQIGYVSDAWVYTGSNNPIAGSCGGNGVAMQPGCLTMRAGPYDASSAVGCVTQASPITIACTATGDSNTGPYGATTLWDQTSFNGATGFVTDAWVYTGTANPVAGTCSSIPPRPPHLNQTSVPNGVRGKPYSTTFTTTNGASPYTYSAITSSLPPGLRLGSGGRLYGTPSKAGTYAFTVTVADGESPPVTAQAGYTLKIRPIAVRTSMLHPATKGKAYSASLAAWGGVYPLTWTIASGALPKGLHLSGSGVISGTASKIGTSSFTVRVRDKVGHTAKRALALKVG